MIYRLDEAVVNRGLLDSRSQAENYIKLGKVKVDGKVVKKPGTKITETADVYITTNKRYVSRGGFKLESVADRLNLNFHGKTVLDVGSSTGGFSDFALQHGAQKIIAVDVGTNQLSASLRPNPMIELHEQTDIKDIKTLSTKINLALIDVAFTSVRPILVHLAKILEDGTTVVAMVKPQFEAPENFKHKGVIKNQAIRRKLFKSFEEWVKGEYKIMAKADSEVSGEKGNVERFYKLVVLA